VDRDGIIIAAGGTVRNASDALRADIDAARAGHGSGDYVSVAATDVGTYLDALMPESK